MTAARGRDVDLASVVGSTITAVDARGKHLLIRFSSGHVLHTHMRMTGSWHVYPRGRKWRRPAFQARAVIECGDRLAVCFNAPVVELVRDHDERVHPSLRRLGPDVLSPAFDLAEAVRRARAGPSDRPIGDMLLDQTVVAGLGNIYRCEALFHERINPWTSVGELTNDNLGQLILRAKDLIERGATNMRIARHVHGQHRRPCARCGTAIEAKRSGPQARVVFFCPECQQSREIGHKPLSSDR